MATDIFLKIGDIKGESQDDKHKEEIDVLAWTWGVTQGSSTHVGGGGGRVKADFSDLTFTHYIDKATANLLKCCATGQHVNEAKLTVRKAGKAQLEFLVITMNEVIITNVAPAGNRSGDGFVENVSLDFAKIEFEYKPQKVDGSLAAGVRFKWNIKANSEG